jgi:uncharacterized membrane protein YfhO
MDIHRELDITEIVEKAWGSTAYDAFIGLRINEGNGRVELKYRPPYWSLR